MNPTVLLSEEEFLNLPDTSRKQELLDGKLFELPPAKLTHMKFAMRLYEMLRAQPEGSRACIETGYRLRPRRWLTPDVSIPWRNQAVEDDYFQGGPLLVVEIASRGNSPEQIDQKIAAYLEAGTGEVWVIYPKTRSMMVIREADVRRVTGSYRSELAGVNVDLDELIPR